MDKELNLKYRQVVIESADIKKLKATAYTIVEAPKAGYVHVPISVILTHVFDTAAYALSGADHKAVITGFTAFTDGQYQALLEATANYTIANHQSGVTGELVNGAITLQDPGTGEAATGQGKLIVRILYATVPTTV